MKFNLIHPHDFKERKNRQSGPLLRVTLRSFLTYFFFLCLPVFIFSSSVFYSMIDRERQEDEIRLRCEGIANSFTERLNSIYSSVSSLFETSWFKHYVVRSDLYDDDFNILTRMEICRQLDAIACGTQMASDVIVIVPSRQMVISSTGWFKIDEYVGIADTVEIELASDTGRAQAMSKTSFAGAVLSYYYVKTAQDISTICVLLDREEISAYVRSIGGDMLPYIKLTCAGQILYESGNPAGLSQYTLTVGKITPLELTAGYDYGGMELRETLGRYLQLILIITGILVVLAALLTVIKHIPLNRLIRKSLEKSPSERGDVYEILDAYVDSVTEENVRLREHNKSMDASLKRMNELLKNELAYAMLSDPDFDLSDEFVSSVLPWAGDGLPFVLSVIVGTGEDDIPDEETLKTYTAGCAHFARFRIFKGEYCLMVWYASVEEARIFSNEFTARMTAKPWRYAVSPLLTDLRDLRESYVLLKNELDMPPLASIPIMEQMNFIQKIQTNRYDECLKVLESAKNRYRPTDYLDILKRLAREYELEEEICRPAPTENETEMWNEAAVMAKELCRRLALLKRRDSAESAELIRIYIDEHYQDPDISIKKLAEEFNIGGTLISKLFKSNFGVSFTDYLLEIRMKHAIILIMETDRNMTAISEEVGYLNCFSFKRAFIRHLGISPKEYRTLHKA